MSIDIVKKIDKNFLDHGTREEFRNAILELLNLMRDQALRLDELERSTLQLQNELRRLKGEKKSPSSSQQPDLISRYPSNR